MDLQIHKTLFYGILGVSYFCIYILYYFYYNQTRNENIKQHSSKPTCKELGMRTLQGPCHSKDIHDYQCAPKTKEPSINVLF